TSKKASCGLTATAYGATASTIPQQKRVVASAAAGRPTCAFPRNSSGSRSRRGSSPPTSGLRFSSTAPASRRARPAGEAGGRPPASGGVGGPGLDWEEAAAALPAADGLLQRAPCGELRHRGRRDMHLLARVARVHAHPRLPLGGRELSESREVDLIAPRQRVRDRLEHGVDGLGRLALAEATPLGDCIDELLLCHLGPPPLDLIDHAPEATSRRALSAQPSLSARLFPSTTSAARKSGCSRTPRRARVSTPPSSRSMTQMAVRHSSAACRRARTASAAAPPEVTTSSIKMTRSPAAYAPSIRFAVPYSFASPRTIRNGRREASEAAAASAKAPSSGPARRTAARSVSSTAA